jgi:GWxTD domain-containing protein
MLLPPLALALVVAGPLQGRPLSGAHRAWLEEEVAYIITDAEQKQFRSLTTTEARDRFIENFWRVRDPVPETLANEYREEHYRRIAEANRRFGRETAREGFRTERGRTLIVLGEPNDIQRFPSPRDLYPLEIWHYYNLEIPGLPPSLRLMFFKRRGMGEYRLFSPAFDGLPALVAGHQLLGQLGNPFRPLPSHLLASIERDILEASTGVAPGYEKHASEAVLADLGRPGIVHERLLRKLRTEVTAEVVFGQRMKVEFAYHAFPEKDGFTAIHFAAEVPPEELTFTEYEEAVRGRVDILGSVQDAASNTVEQFQDVAEFAFTQDAFQSTRGYPFLYQRKLLLLPGRYQVELLLRDTVGRKLGTVQQAIQVAAFPADKPAASSLVLCYKVDTAGEKSAAGLPYRFSGNQYFPKVDGAFSPGQTIYAFIELASPRPAESLRVEAHIRLNRGGTLAREDTRHFRLGAVSGEWRLPLLIPISTEGLEPGSYALQVSLSDPEGGILDESEIDLQIKAEPAVLGRLLAEGKPAEDFAQQHLDLGMKYYYAGRVHEAAARLRAALDFDPRLSLARLYLGSALALSGQVDSALPLIEASVKEDPLSPEAQAALGYCLFRLGRFADAAAAYREALKGSPAETRLLNALGESELRAGNRPGAIEALSRSLEMDPSQTQVKSLLEEARGGSKSPR